jgi:hypothetical protein
MTSIKNPFFFLLGGLLVALLVAPITTEHLRGISGMMLTGTLLIAVLSLVASKRMYIAAWSLAYLEAICGVMYVAVLVSALVGSYGSKRVAQA